MKKEITRHKSLAKRQEVFKKKEPSFQEFIYNDQNFGEQKIFGSIKKIGIQAWTFGKAQMSSQRYQNNRQEKVITRIYETQNDNDIKNQSFNKSILVNNYKNMLNQNKNQYFDTNSGIMTPKTNEIYIVQSDCDKEEIKDYEPIRRKIRDFSSLQGLQMLSRTDVPQKIYIREKEDVVKQLSSIGAKTYNSSHKQPYGDAAQIKAFSNKEYEALWDKIRQENFDNSSPFCKKPPTPREVDITSEQDYSSQNKRRLIRFKTQSYAGESTSDYQRPRSMSQSFKTVKKVFEINKTPEDLSVKKEASESEFNENDNIKVQWKQQSDCHKDSQRIGSWKKSVQEHFQQFIAQLEQQKVKR